MIIDMNLPDNFGWKYVQCNASVVSIKNIP